MDQATSCTGSAVPIGYPVEGMEVLLLDEHGEPVGPHEVGQIAVRSAYLAVGYWRQPELTRQVFLPDPDGGEYRLYLTGDLGVMNEDGSLTHAGRRDFQVKVRGQRVEVSEIETALRSAPGVAEAVVVARAELAEETCLVAYVVAAQGATPPTSRSLRDFLKRRLPESSIPAAFVFLDAMPLTATGKMDRKALPAPGRDRCHRPRERAAPRTELQERIAAIWEELTDYRPVGIDDNFFEVGGNSLLGVRLFSEIHRTLGKNLPLETLLSAPTIERLAKVLSDALAEAAPRSLVVALKAGGSQAPFFAIPGTVTHPLCFYDLARLSEPEQPFFGLLYPKPGPDEPYPTTIEGLAARLIPEIQSIQPKGPYRIGGHSFGGLVAFELAHQLIALGHQVSLLALFDTWGPSFPAMRPLPWRLIDHLERMGALGGREKMRYLAEKGTALLRRLAPAAVGRFVPESPVRNPDLTEEAEELMRINHLARCRYQPRPYPGRLVVFRAEQTPNWVGTQFDDSYLGWKKLAAQGVEVHTTPADHWKLLHREYVKPLARVLNAYLREGAELS
jgi:thioesterase domain-containing protein